MKEKFRFPKINLSQRLLLILLAIFFLGNFLPLGLQSFFYALSITLKSFLMFVFPIIIFFCLFSCLMTFRGKALSFVMALLAMVCFSNYFSTMISYLVSSQIVNIDLVKAEPLTKILELQPLWNMTLPHWLSNEKALLLSLIVGLIISFFFVKEGESLNKFGKRFVTLFLGKFFIPILPIFALGFIVKMQHDGILGQILQSYLPLIGVIFVTYILYLGFLFGLGSGFRRSRWIEYLKKVIPAAVMGFSTMSSMAALPVTLKAAEENTEDAAVANAVIPATVNIHLVGDSIAIPLMAIAILLNFDYPFPNMAEYAVFAFYFVMAKFVVAAVPGGGIIVMIPILEAHLGFTPEMSALITTLYILFDPIITATNVLGNSAFAIILSKLCKKTFSSGIEKPST